MNSEIKLSHPNHKHRSNFELGLLLNTISTPPPFSMVHSDCCWVQCATDP